MLKVKTMNDIGNCLYNSRDRITNRKQRIRADSYAAITPTIAVIAIYIKFPRKLLIQIILPPSFHKVPVLHYLPLFLLALKSILRIMQLFHH